MSDLLKCGVAGAGVFGGHHARQYARLAGARLVAVYDHHSEHARMLATALGAEAFDELAPFLAAVEAVSVTAPAVAHAEIAGAALKAGRHVYVEKPMAATVEEAEGLLNAAHAAGLVLAVGHQERMVFRAMGLFDLPERPVLLQAMRKGPFSGRNGDVSCVLDLMIHDIDLALALNPAEVLAVEAEGEIIEGPYADAVKAEATFDDGMTAIFEASRIAEARERRMRIVYPSGEVEIDFLTRVFRNTTPFSLDANFTDTPVGKDPLGAALGAFVAAARGEARALPAGPHDGVRALDLALAVEQATGL